MASFMDWVNAVLWPNKRPEGEGDGDRPDFGIRSIGEPKERAQTKSILLGLHGIKEFDKISKNRIYHYLDIPKSKWFYIRINNDGKFEIVEHDIGEPGNYVIRKDYDAVLSELPKETAKDLYFHLDLLEK